MKFPFLHAACLLIALITVFAGCSSTSSVPVTGTPDTIKMSQLILSPAEMPFAAVSENTKNPDLKDPMLSRFGALQGLTRYSLSETAESPTSSQFGQMIVEYPEGNAALAFAAFVDQTRSADQTTHKITWMPDPGIANQSCGLIIADRSGKEKPTAMIVFVKSNIMESVVMVSASTDYNTLTRAARAAAAKIP